MTIKDVAREVGLAPTTLGLLEKGAHDPSLGTMLALVRFYDLCSIEELISECRLGTAVLLGQPHRRPGNIS
jgi:DNA-binding XRE family transcriptional regulator